MVVTPESLLELPESRFYGLRLREYRDQTRGA